jgi:hypothetical protein
MVLVELMVVINDDDGVMLSTTDVEATCGGSGVTLTRVGVV